MKTSQKVKLGDMCSIRTGKLDSNAAVEGGKYPFFTCAQETYSIDKYAFDTEAVLLGGNNANGIFPLKYYQGKFNAYQRTYIIESNDRSKLSNKFIYFSLRPVLEYLKSASIGAATQYLTKPVLDNLKISLPDIDTQRNIIDIIYAYDELIYANCARIQLLEESARLLFREWFVYLKFPHSTSSGQANHEKVKIVDGIPEGWERAKVKDFGMIVTGKTPSTKVVNNFNGDIPFIKTPDMHRSLIIINSEESLSESGADSQKNKYLPPWSVLVSCIGTVGVVALNLFKSQTNQQINSIIPKKNIYRYYCFFFLSRLKPILEAIGGGATMANVNKYKFENLDVIIPPDTLLERFDKLVDLIFKQIAFLVQQNEKLTYARDLLLPRLMSGAIEV